MKKYINSCIVLAGLFISMASCLKENNYPPLYGRSSPNVISFQDNGGSNGAGAGFGSTTTPYPLYQFSFKLAALNDTTGFDGIVIYGPNGGAPEDITLNITVDQSALDSFNNSNSTSYTIPDPSIFSVPSSVVIHKGQSQAYVHMTITLSSAFDFNASYAIPLTITSASSGAISANFASEINAFADENIYDGSYTLNIQTIGWAAYGISDGDPGTYPGNIGLVTQGPNSVSLNVPNYGGLEPAFTAGNAGGTAFGATTPLFTFDPTTNDLISVVNTTPDDGRGRTLYLNPAVTDSRYDPTTQTVYAAYIMTQNGRPNQQIFDTLVYKGPR